ncbi:hypothetical protein NUM3379_23760 [Kineococcus sp. NUM-3379]
MRVRTGGSGPGAPGGTPGPASPSHAVPLRRAAPAALATGALGAVCGAVAKVGDGVPWLGPVADGAAVWLLAVALLVRSAPGTAQAVVRPVVFCAAMVLGYYAWTAHVLGYPVGTYPRRWLAVAFSAVPLAALVLRWTFTRRGVLPGLALALAAGWVLAGGHVRRLWLALDGVPWPAGSAGLPVAAFEVLVAGVLAAVLPAHHRTRVVAVLLTVPAAVCWVLWRVDDRLLSLVA